jgi:hypothetical protein
LQEQIQSGLEESDDEFETAFFEGLFENMADVCTPRARGTHGGSVPGWRYVYRDREACHE